jgi:hypothetical protein
LTRYGGAIQRDLFDRGWDLADLWAGRRWRLLLNMIEGLPSNSHYIAALADDEELAASFDGDPAPRPPRLTEWSPEVAAIVASFDRLGDILCTLIAANGGKPPKIPPYPRPVTAAERVKQQRRMLNHRELVARVLPNRN